MAADAIADFTRAIELNPDLLDAYYYRAKANEFLKPHQTNLMINDLQKVLELDTSYRSDKWVRNYISL
jgi:tetratricopeptide (TPR) repeat protein